MTHEKQRCYQVQSISRGYRNNDIPKDRVAHEVPKARASTIIVNNLLDAHVRQHNGSSLAIPTNSQTPYFQ